MSRTAEQVAADDALAAAVDACRLAYWPEVAGTHILTDFVVVFAEVDGVDSDKDMPVGRLVRDGNLPSYRIAGLLRHAAKALDADTFRPGEA